MRSWMVLLLLASIVALVVGQEREDGSPPDESESDGSQPKESWWKGFKERVKQVMSRWRDDIKLLWDDVLAKADDMKSWTAEAFDSLKEKLKEWVEKRAEVPDDEKNEIETFISKLKVPTESPKSINP